MIRIEDTPIWREVEKVINSGSKPVHYTYTAKIHVGNKTYDPFKLISFDNERDYELNYSDDLIVKLSIPAGMFTSDIYPFKDQIEISMIASPNAEVGSAPDGKLPHKEERFRATLLDKGNPLIEGNSTVIPSKDSMDISNFYEISFQLINKAVERLRMISIGGIYRNTTAASVIRALLTNESKKLSIPGALIPVGVDFAPNFNPTVREHVIIPQGIKLVDAPGYIHHKCGGVYSAGFNYYLQGNLWYCFPSYDVTRFSKTNKTLTIINVPKNRFSNIERTYLENGNSTTILATGEVRFRDESEIQQLNLGNGVMFAKADNFLDGYATVKDNKAVISRDSNVVEVVGANRQVGINNVLLSDNPITSNEYLEFSKIARRQGNIITLVWENSNPDLITPGIPVKIYYIDNTKVGTIYGVCLKLHHFTSSVSSGISTKHVTKTAMVIFTNIVRQ